MEKRTLTCIGCPMGCQVSVSYEIKDGAPNMDTMEVTGNTCPRGKAYAIDEVTNPTRIVTGTVCASNRENKVISVKTAAPVPKEKVMEVAEEFMKLKVEAPRKIGDVVCENVADTGVAVIVTRGID